MISLIQNELKKIFKKKSLLITLLVTLAFIILTNVLYKLDFGNSYYDYIEEEISFYREQLKTLDPEKDKDMYAQYKTELEVYQLVKKYGEKSWQAQIIQSEMRGCITEINYFTYQEKNNDELKAVKARLHREYSGQIKSATVSQVSSGKYYVSILVETEHKELAHTNHNIGIDLGIKDLCITSDGRVYENLKIIKKYEKQLVKLQRQLSHKGKRSKNYYKTKKKIALCHEKIRNIRKDYLHKVSYEIISENQVIVSENLQIKNMVKNHHLAKAISDVSWYELTRQLEYKAKWNGRKYIKIDTFYASSQICSVCGNQNPDTKDLSVRTWICPKCGAEHDRDINAAKNILTEGLRQIA